MTDTGRHDRMDSASRFDAGPDPVLHDLPADLPRPAPAGPAFIQRLLAIPETAGQSAAHGFFARLAAAFIESGDGLSHPRFLAGEAVAFAGALALGLWLGATTTTGSTESVDLSAYLLADLNGPLDVGGDTQ